ncbi:MAG: FAD-dependent oxidoreductase [Pseudonocardiales bacterium]|nr:FAD-dependent oxidoreductase [Pseudonocardiales bacterium]
MTVTVVGAGISGIACARELTARGVPVRVLERGRTVGGRMASRRLHGRPVDMGAAYFTARDPEFTEVVHRWRDAGLAREWTDELAVLPGAGRSSGPVRWAAPGGLRSLVADLATGLDVTCEHPAQRVGPGPTVDGEPADAVVLAMPDPQAARLYPVPDAPAWTPVIAVAAGWEERHWPDLPAAFVNDHPVLTLVADDGARRGDGAPVLVAHTTADVVRAHDADPDGAVPAVLDALRELFGGPPPAWTYAHRWRFASPGQDREEPFHLGDDGVGLAGDGWGRARVETAWRSGTLLARAVAKRLGR